MSIGAKGIDILSQFLIESILISVTGGLIGVIFGVGSAIIVNQVAHFPIFIQPWSVLLSFIVCTATGIFFGWYPAKKAAQLDPSGMNKKTEGKGCWCTPAVENREK